MKTFLTAAALTLGMATVAMAGDFDNNTFGVEVTSGVLDFSVDASENGMTDFAVGATGFAHKLGTFDASVRGELSYNFDADTIGVRGEYNLVTALEQNLTLYGSAAVEYVTAETDLADGDFYFDPSAGVAYAFDDKLSVFAEVGYTWDMSNDFNGLGGYLEVGMPYNLTDNFTVTPSIVQGFDDGVEEMNLRLVASVSF